MHNNPLTALLPSAPPLRLGSNRAISTQPRPCFCAGLQRGSQLAKHKCERTDSAKHIFPQLQSTALPRKHQRRGGTGSMCMSESTLPHPTCSMYATTGYSETSVRLSTAGADSCKHVETNSAVTRRCPQASDPSRPHLKLEACGRWSWAIFLRGASSQQPRQDWLSAELLKRAAGICTGNAGIRMHAGRTP